MRVKQFDERIEDNPDFIVMRNHISKSVTGDGKKVMLMGSLWRLIHYGVQISAGSPLDYPPLPEPEPYPPLHPATIEPVQKSVTIASAQIGPASKEK